jgi:hypothetical protein
MAFTPKFKNENKVVANTDIYPQLKGEIFACHGDSFISDGVEKVMFRDGKIENILFKTPTWNKPQQSFKVEHFRLADTQPIDLDETKFILGETIVQIWNPNRTYECANDSFKMKELIPLEWNDGRSNDSALDSSFRIEPRMKGNATVYAVTAYKANAKNKTIQTPDSKPFGRYDKAVQAVERYRNETIQKFFKP